MIKKNKAYVLDAWTILTFFEDKKNGKKIADLIADANDQDIPLLISVFDLGKVWYIMTRLKSEKSAEDAIIEIQQLGINTVEIDWNISKEAAKIKAQSKISFMDCLTIALARINKATLITGNLDFVEFENLLNILWI